MRVLAPLVVLLALVLRPTSASAAPPTRAQFAGKLATIAPGMTDAQVTQALGAPDDIKTERDPGGISAARTVEVWRYGTHGHGTFATLGTVHLQADHKVQYVFGGAGTPYGGIAEPELRRLLELVDGVPSYNATLEPLRLIRAVNALHPLGKDRALAVIDEYLRVSSDLDDPGREGVFLLLRALFDVPPGGMPPMMVGAPSPAAPKDTAALPRFPLVIVDDVPLTLVAGYALAGEAEPPAMDVAAFRKVGTLRKRPLAPAATALDAIDRFVAGPLAKAMPVDDGLRSALYDQVLRLFGTVSRPAELDGDAWFPGGKDVAARWSKARRELAKLGATWNPKHQQFERANGATLPPLPAGSARVWWDLALPGTTKARLTFERRSDRRVDVELRLELAPGAVVKADVVRILDPGTNRELAKLPIQALAAPVNSTTGLVTSQRFELPRGQALRPELASGPRGASLTP